MLMIDASNILAIASSHFTLHLLAPGEADVPPEGGEETTTPLPENLVEDFLDEALDMVDEIAELYVDKKGWEKALVFGFTDGVLAVSDGSWSTCEDSYFEDADNPDYAAIDAAIDEIVADFDGSRPWDEATKGYVRKAIARADADPTAMDQDLWTACAHAFVYGAEAAYDLEWKVVVTPAGNLLITDEEAIDDALMAKMAADSNSGSLLDRIFDMVGIDPNELAAALGADDADELDEEPVEAELLNVEDVDGANK